MRGCTSFHFPETAFMIGYKIKPTAIPVAMLEVRGIMRIMANAGNASSNWFHIIFARPSIMKQPTIINIGAVMAGSMEIAEINGEKTIEIKNNPATTTAVNPVLPPAATPDDDSM